MVSELTYFAAEVAAITAFGLLGLVFLRSYRQSENILLFAIIFASNFSYLLTRMSMKADPAFQFDLGVAYWPMHVMMNTGAGVWMILCHSLFQDAKRFPRWVFAIFIVQVLLSALRPVLLPGGFATLDQVGFDDLNYLLFGSLPLVLQSAFGLAALYWIFKGWRVDLVESRRMMRWFFLGGVSFMYFGVTALELAMIEITREQQIMGHSLVTFGTLGINVALALTFLRFDVSVATRFIVENSIKKNDVESGQGKIEDEAAVAHFYAIFRDQKAYLEPGLSIGILAKKLSMPQYKLRVLINSQLGYKNFNALLNEYRINEACEQMSNPQNDNLPILTIALTVGYQSIAPFNRAFRELKKITPSDYRRSTRQA